MSLAPSTSLRAALDALADAAREFEFRLAGEQAVERRQKVEELVATVDQYLLPRLASLDGPALAVVLGSTGSGKSTLVNSLAQASITRPGPVRPTTRRPVAWTHHTNVDAIDDGGGLMELATTRDDFVRDLVIVDAPDFDSVVADHREMVEELITKADFAVFVTTAQRYADGVPWDVLRTVVARGIPLMTIINRMPPGALGATDGPVSDFTRLLKAEGVTAEPPVVIDEQPVDPLHGGLPAGAVQLVREQLQAVGDAAEAVVLASTRGAVARVVHLAGVVAGAHESETEELGRLANVVAQAYDEQAVEFDADLRDGSMIRDEVLQRWNEQLGASQLFSEVGEGLGRARAWLRRVFGGPAPMVRAEAETEVAAELARRAGIAARQVATAWDLDEGARGLLDERAWSAAPSTRETAHDEIERWLDRVASLVRERGEGRRRIATAASYGVNALAILTLIAVFSQTAGLTGAEVGITAGAAAVQQKLLEYVLGTAAARTLVSDARAALMDAVRATLASDAARFDVSGLRSGDSEALRRAAAAVDDESRRFYG